MIYLSAFSLYINMNEILFCLTLLRESVLLCISLMRKFSAYQQQLNAWNKYIERNDDTCTLILLIITLKIERQLFIFIAQWLRGGGRSMISCNNPNGKHMQFIIILYFVHIVYIIFTALLYAFHKTLEPATTYELCRR